MLRDDDLNHEEQKQVLELAINFHHDASTSSLRSSPAIAIVFDKPSPAPVPASPSALPSLAVTRWSSTSPAPQLGRGEPVADTARVLDRMAYGVVWRTFGQDRVEEMAKYFHPSGGQRPDR